MTDQPNRGPVHNHGAEEGRGLACREVRSPDGSLRGQCLAPAPAEDPDGQETTPTRAEIRECFQMSGDGLDFKRVFTQRGEAFDRWWAQVTGVGRLRTEVPAAVIEQAAQEYSAAPFPSAASRSRMRRAAPTIWGAAQADLIQRLRAGIRDVTVVIDGIEYVRADQIRGDLGHLADGDGAADE